MGDVFYGYLAILCGVADVLSVGSYDIGELCLEGVNNIPRFVQTEGGLREIGNPFRIRYFEGGHFFYGGDYLGHFRSFAQSAFYLVMVPVPDEDQRIPLAGELHRLHVDLCHQRAGGIDHF